MIITKEQQDNWLHGGLIEPITYPRRTTSLVDQIALKQTLNPITDVIYERYRSFEKMEECLKDPRHLFYNR